MLRKVLLIGDQEDVLFFIRVYLSARGFQVDCATDAEEAALLLTSQRYLAVLLDTRLTHTDRRRGLSMIRFIREQCRDLGIIVLTPYGAGEMEAEALKSGANVLMKKSQPLSEIARTISSLTGKESIAVYAA